MTCVRASPVGRARSSDSLRERSTINRREIREEEIVHVRGGAGRRRRRRRWDRPGQEQEEDEEDDEDARQKTEAGVKKKSRCTN